MSRTITIGGLSARSCVAEELELPLLAGTDAGAILRDALDLAGMERRGVGVFGSKGSGKSLEIVVRVAEWDDAEAMKRAADAGYRVRRIAVVSAPRVNDRTAARRGKASGETLSYRAVLVAVLEAVMGDAPNERTRGRRKYDHDLLREAVDALRAQQYAVIVIEEGERLAPDGLTALRDLMAEAERTDPDRIVVDPRSGRRSVRPGGVGIVLVGTPEVRTRLEVDADAGERWAAVESIAGLSAESAPAVFLQFFPRFADAQRTHDAGTGRGAWANGVTAAVANGHPTVSFRLVENVARDYFRLLVRNTPPEAEAPTRLTAWYDAALFRFVAQKARWHHPGGGDGSDERTLPDDGSTPGIADVWIEGQAEQAA